MIIIKHPNKYPTPNFLYNQPLQGYSLAVVAVTRQSPWGQLH